MRLAKFLLLPFLLLFFCASSAAAAEPPAISAKAACVVDARTGIVLYAKSADTKRPIASLTKVMTAVVAAEEIKSWHASTRASRHATEAGESEIYLEPGEKIQLIDLLYSILLKSANDASVALAEACAGSEELFVALMNRRAAQLGMENTHFANPHGLDAPGHYSTARDLAILARYSLNFPLLRQIFATRRRTIPWPGNDYDRVLVNHNKLLFRYDFVKGIKTGYTSKAGNCLISYADFGDSQIIAVVLGAPGPQACYTDSLALLKYGRSLMQEKQFFARNRIIFAGDDFKIRNSEPVILRLPSFVTTPTLSLTYANTAAGTPVLLKYTYGGQLLGVFPGKVEREQEKSFWEKVGELF